MTCWSCSARIRRAPMRRARTQILLLLPAYKMHRCCCHHGLQHACTLTSCLSSCSRVSAVLPSNSTHRRLIKGPLLGHNRN